ncbi:MAG: NAD-binding protein [Burkholderiales bacterium]
MRFRFWRPRRRRRALLRTTRLPRILKRIYLSAGVLVLLIVIGTGGFYFGAAPGPTFSDAMHMTLITITTVGYGEVVPLHTVPEQVFAGMLAIAGFGTLTFLFTSLTVFFLETDLDETLRRRRMEKRIKMLRQHYIVCGFGRVGRNIAQELYSTGRHFVAIDPDASNFEMSRERFPGLLYLHGDASDDDLMIAGDVANARGVFAVTGDDGKNIMVTLTAKQINPRVRVVARCHELRNAEKLRKAGADNVVSPDFTGGMRLASTMIRPHVVSFFDEMLRSEHKLRLEEIVVPEHFKPRGLGTVDLRSNEYVVLAVRVGKDWHFNPPEDFQIKAGHVIIAMTTPLGVDQLEIALLP